MDKRYGIAAIFMLALVGNLLALQRFLAKDYAPWDPWWLKSSHFVTANIGVAFAVAAAFYLFTPEQDQPKHFVSGLCVIVLGVLGVIVTTATWWINL